MDGRNALWLLLLVPALSGCLGGDDVADTGDGTDGTAHGGITDVFDRVDLPFNVTGPWSRTLEAGPYEKLEPYAIDVPYELGPEEGGAALDPLDPPRVNMGIWLPDVPEGTQVPVIVDAGPYYKDGDLGVTEWSDGRLSGMLIDNFVPHGYAVALVSVAGTGDSNHCMDMMGDAEQASIHAAVEYLGQAGWSNGNVGMIGRSYDGSTPWQAAAMGSEHLKTIVPISGLTGIPELMFNNGAPESRTLTFHNVVYGTFAVDGDLGDVQNACPDYLASGAYQGAEAGAQGYAGNNPYFAERRFFQRAIENYDGSVYLIHGLQDWNVDPHAALPYFSQMQERWEAKGLFGQWDHAYPDRPADHSDLTAGRGLEAGTATVRYDWAQDLKEWFDHYLMETGPQPALHVEVQDNLGHWRVEQTWPPQDAEDLVLSLDDADGPTTLNLMAAGGDTGEYVWPALSETEDTLLGGIPVFSATVIPSAPQGLVYAELRDADTDLRLGHGILDIRYPDGGDHYEVPGAVVEFAMPMEAMELYLPAGHGLKLIVAESGEGYTIGVNTAPNTFQADGATLTFKSRDAADVEFFQPPDWEPVEE